MSGTETASNLIPSRDVTAGTSDVHSIRDRLAWPAAAVLILLASGGLWYGAAIALTSLFS